MNLKYLKKNPLFAGVLIGFCLSLLPRIQKPDLTTQKIKTKILQNFLLISVLTSNDFLETRSRSTYETWAKNYSHIKFFTQSNQVNSDLPVVFLPNTDDSYPPQRKSFSMLKYLYDNYLDSYEWFLRADDDVYIKIDKLIPFLRSLNSSKVYYIGQPGFSNSSNYKYLQLNGFCMGGPGIVLSRETLKQIGPHLNYCYKNLVKTKHEDVEIARCIKEFVNVSCTLSFEMKSVFSTLKKTNKESLLLNIPESHRFKKAISIHPFKDTQSKYIMHLNQLKTKLIELKSQVINLKSMINLNSYGPKIFFDSNFYYGLDGPKKEIDEKFKFLIYNLNVELNEQIRNYYSRKGIEIKSDKTVLGYFKVSNTGLEFLLHNVVRLGKSNIKFDELKEVFVPFLEPDYELEEIDEKKKINFILPFCERILSLEKFMKNYEDICLKSTQNTTLIIILCKNYNYQESRQLIDRLKNIYQDASIEILDVEFEFSRGQYIRIGTEFVKENELMFFIDVDILFNRDFLYRLRANTISDEQIYAPIVFNEFNPNMLGSNSSASGEWRSFGYGMIGIYKKDFERTNGFDETIVGWGKEDVDFIMKIVNMSYFKVFRTIDPGLIHVYHEKKCSKKLSKDQYSTCVGSRIRASASKLFLSNLYYSKV